MKLKNKKNLKIKNFYKNFYIKLLLKNLKNYENLHIRIYDNKLIINEKVFKFSKTFIKNTDSIDLSFLNNIVELNISVCTNKITKIVLPQSSNKLEIVVRTNKKRLKITARKNYIRVNEFAIMNAGKFFLQLFPKIATKVKIQKDLKIGTLRYRTILKNVNIKNLIFEKNFNFLYFSDVSKIKYKNKNLPEKINEFYLSNLSDKFYHRKKNTFLKFRKFKNFENFINRIVFQKSVVINNYIFKKIKLNGVNTLDLRYNVIHELCLKNIKYLDLENTKINNLKLNNIEVLLLNFETFIDRIIYKNNIKKTILNTTMSYEHSLKKYNNKYIHNNLLKFFREQNKKNEILIELEHTSTTNEVFQHNFICNKFSMFFNVFIEYYLNYDLFKNYLNIKKEFNIQKNSYTSKSFTSSEKFFITKLLLLENLLDDLINIFENSKTKNELKIQLKEFFKKNILNIYYLNKDCINLLKKFHIIKNNKIHKLNSINTLKI